MTISIDIKLLIALILSQAVYNRQVKKETNNGRKEI